MEWPGMVGFCSLVGLLVSLGLRSTREAFGMRKGLGVFLALAVVTFCTGLVLAGFLVALAFTLR